MKSLLLSALLMMSAHHAFAQGRCVQIIKPTKAYASKDFQNVEFAANKVYPAFQLSPKKNYIRIQRDNVPLWIPVQDVKNIKSDICIEKPSCLTVKESALFLKTPRAQTGVRATEVNARYPVVAQTQIDGTLFYRISFNNEMDYWVKSTEGDFEENTCAATEQGVKNRENKFLEIGFELGYISGLDNAAYTNTKASIPDASNVGSLPTPLITDINKGSGFVVSPCVRKKWGWFRMMGCFAYQDVTFKYSGKSNPDTAGGISLSSLDNMSGEFTQKTVGVDGYAQAAWNFHKKHSAVFGLGARSFYLITEKILFNFQTGAISKQEARSVVTGPSQFSNGLIGRLEYEYAGFSKTSALTSLNAGLGFDNNMAMMLTFGAWF